MLPYKLGHSMPNVFVIVDSYQLLMFRLDLFVLAKVDLLLVRLLLTVLLPLLVAQLTHRQAHQLENVHVMQATIKLKMIQLILSLVS